jgi:hypothetical protein
MSLLTDILSLVENLNPDFLTEVLAEVDFIRYGKCDGFGNVRFQTTSEWILLGEFLEGLTRDQLHDVGRYTRELLDSRHNSIRLSLPLVIVEEIEVHTLCEKDNLHSLHFGHI